MENIAGKKRNTVIAIVAIISLISLVFQALPETAHIELRYDRNQPTQVWRFVTGQLLHLGWVHLLFNLAGLVLITALFFPEWSARSFLYAFITSGIFLNICLYLFSPELTWYVGLSGILHGLIAAGAVYSYQVQAKFALIVLIGCVIKIAWEQITGSSVGTEELIGGKVAFDAHMFGFIGGLIGAALFRATALRKQKSQ